MTRASGSRAPAARARLQAKEIPTAVVSMPCVELPEIQDEAHRRAVLERGPACVGPEAALRSGWDRWLGERGAPVGMAGLGASGPADALTEHFAITPAAVVAAAKRLL